MNTQDLANNTLSGEVHKNWVLVICNLGTLTNTRQEWEEPQWIHLIEHSISLFQSEASQI